MLQTVIQPTRRGAVQLIDRGDGCPLMSLHGGLGGCDQSLLLAQALFADLTPWRVLAVSRPGYLDTPLVVGNTPEREADAYAALLDELEIDRADVAAISAGGPSALQFALRHPDRCEALILVSAASGRLDVSWRARVRLRLVTLMVKIGMEAWLRRKIVRDPRAAAARSITDPAVLERAFADPEAALLLQALQECVATRVADRLPGTVNDIRLLRAMADLPLYGLRPPVLLLHGTDDPVVPFSHAERIAGSAVRSRLCAIEGAEHVALFTHMDEVRTAVSTFLSEASAIEA